MSYYQSIETCPLSIFKTILSKNDLSLLFIDGKYNEVEAKDAWIVLYDEFNDAIKTGRNNTNFEKTKQIEILENEYSIIKSCVFLVSQKVLINLANSATKLDMVVLNYDFEVKVLNMMGFNVDVNNIEADILRVDKQKENKKTQIKLIEKDLSDGEKQSANWTFNDTIFQCQKHQGYPFNESAKVIDLVSALNDLIRANKPVKKTNKYKDEQH